MKKRIKRHDVIRAIVRGQEIRTQRDLVESLQRYGFECTQATISRDINDMGLEKTGAGGVYMLKEDLNLKRLATDLICEVVVVNNFVIVKTSSGMAQGVAAAIDMARLDNVIGTIAGDDTIFIATALASQAENAAKMINELRSFTPVLSEENSDPCEE